MRTADFDFVLPSELIAQSPAPRRDHSRLLVLDRRSGKVEHRRFYELPAFLVPGDVLVLNNSRVIPARLRGSNSRSGGQFEMLLLQENGVNDWWAMLRPGKRARPGTQIVLRDTSGTPSNILATVIGKNDEGHGRLRFSGVGNILEALDCLGEMPLPPYIERRGAGDQALDRRRYQTVFAQPAGSVAAPTAGLHFTERLLDEIRGRGIEVCFVSLHVGLGTFAPVKTESLAGHRMHRERYEVCERSAEVINRAKQAGHRVIAAGTTSLRVLESVAAANAGRLLPGAGTTDIFIYPPFEFKMVDALLTNFHLPRSTLLMLVSAFAAPASLCGPGMVLTAYAEAIRRRYRFYSYGDAMLML
jgi:S-adenosylmethionine:tRNA ribosyltransferase-isomerase